MRLWRSRAAWIAWLIAGASSVTPSPTAPNRVTSITMSAACFAGTISIRGTVANSVAKSRRDDVKMAVLLAPPCGLCHTWQNVAFNHW
jgi:hypothetical protein